ncbi:MAG: 50S ribosomal protein L23 [Mollicutes bacterium]|nr:MAG: 50S ribosomal protein L23 [Mollicutes bacterium]
MLPTEIFKKIIITEKTYKLMDRQQIVFLVDLRANKKQIKKAFETIFGYEVLSVNTIRLKAKKKRLGKHVGKTNRRKKAIITLPPGQKFEPMQNDNAPSTSVGGAIPKRSGFFGKFKDKIDSLTKINIKDKKSQKKE